MRTKTDTQLDNGYICLSRNIANGMFSPDEEIRNINRIKAALLILSTPFSCKKKIRRKNHTCNPGDLISTFKEISQRTAMDYYKTREILFKLETEKFIHLISLGGVWKIRIIDYNLHTRKKNKQTPTAQHPQDYEQQALDEMMKMMNE